MSAIEHKTPGTFIRSGELVMQKRVKGDESPSDWNVEYHLLEGDDFS